MKKRISPIEAYNAKFKTNISTPTDIPVEMPDEKPEHAIHDRKLIAWEKWRSPYEQSPEDEMVSSDEYNDDPTANILKPAGAVLTPYGMVPESTFKIFNFWAGHTNFPINKTVQYLIKTTSGVETLDIWTPYRFRIAIGKLFSEDEVKKSINTKLHAYLNPK